jgi:hypothetical protein
MFPLYGDSASGIENATTDNRGRAHIKTAHVYVPLWRYLYGNIYYQCANPCECCLGDCLDYIDKDSIPKRQNSVAVYNSKKQSNSIVTIIDYIPVIQSRSVNWSDINEDAIYRDALTIWKQGQITNIPKEIWGELNKFSPERVMTFEKGVGVRYSDGSGYQINLVRNENFQISEDEQTQFKYVSVYKK